MVIQMVTAREMKPILERSIKKVEKWVERHNYKGYEPFDGLSSFFRPLTFRNNFCGKDFTANRPAKPGQSSTLAWGTASRVYKRKRIYGLGISHNGEDYRRTGI